MVRPIFAASILAAIATTVTASEPSQRTAIGSSVRPGTTATAQARTGTQKKRGTRAKIALTPVQRELRRNASLAGILHERLPVGADLTAESAGFRDLGQFVAAVYASKNLGVPLSELRRRMVHDGMTLGLAIQDARPKCRYWSEARRAEDEAARTIRLTQGMTHRATPASERREPARPKSRPAKPGGRGVA